MIFTSDNAFGVAPEILEAIARTNVGAASSYGGDDITARLQRRFSDVFERSVAVFPVATGTAANALSLATLTPPYGAIFCHEVAHVNVDECGAPEMFSGGAKLVSVGGANGKIDTGVFEKALGIYRKGDVHQVQPACLTLTQSTEAGTVYTPDELKRLASLARERGLAVHMDGSRFANALVSLGCALAAEAVVFFDPARAADFVFRRKRSGHLFSKMRFLSTQLEAYLEDDLWLRLARHANAMAARLARGLGDIEGAVLASPVEANEIFVRMPPATIARLQSAGAAFHLWPASGDGAAGITVRLVTSFATQNSDVDAFLAAACG